MKSVRDMVKAAKQHYPESKHLRKEWVSKTLFLMSTGRHGLLNGGWRREGLG